MRIVLRVGVEGRFWLRFRAQAKVDFALLCLNFGNCYTSLIHDIGSKRLGWSL